MVDASELIATLPFVRKNPTGAGRQFWHVQPTGDRATDGALGSGYAVLAIDMAVATGSPLLVRWIIAEMGRNPEWKAVESGFQRVVVDFACLAMSIARGNQSCVCATLANKSAQEGKHHG
jgi:hypothetical protein